MNYTRKIILVCTSSLFLLHFGKESSIDGGQKPDVNFEGTLLYPSVEENTKPSPVSIDTITIGGKYKKIVVIALQEDTSHKYPKKPNQRILLHNPKDRVRFDLNLSEIDRISVPKKEESWISYNKKKKLLPTEYIEIIVHFKNKSVKHFLIERAVTIKAREKDIDTFLQTSFAGINELVITGYHDTIKEDKTSTEIKNKKTKE